MKRMLKLAFIGCVAPLGLRTAYAAAPDLQPATSARATIDVAPNIALAPVLDVAGSGWVLGATALDGTWVSIASDGAVRLRTSGGWVAAPAGPTHITAFVAVDQTDLWASALENDRPVFTRLVGTQWAQQGVIYPGAGAGWPDVIASLRVTGVDQAVAFGDSGATYRFDGRAWTAELPRWSMDDADVLAMPGALASDLGSHHQR